MRNQNPITILMAVYDGAAFLRQQLDSIAAQSHGDWRLVISDDGSRDDSRAICAIFRDQHGGQRVQLIDGPQAGPTRNFLHLIGAAPDDHALAFCDQDDVWLPHKLTRADQHLTGRDGPALYCARTLLCDEHLNNRSPSRNFQRPHAFRNALVQACTPGNTSVFNAEAAHLLKQAAGWAATRDVPSHDWWAYQVVSGAGGQVIFDAEPALLYRQHGENVMGRNDTLIAKLRRLTMLMDGNYGGWLARNHAALSDGQALLSPENRYLLDDFGQMLSLPGPAALQKLRQIGAYRQTGSGDIALYLAAGSGRLRHRPAKDQASKRIR